MNKIDFNTVVFIIICLFLLYIIFKLLKSKNYSGDKINKIITDNLDTVYIIVKRDDNKVIYLSNNVYDILGIKINDKSEITKKVLELPRIKEELHNWDKTSSHVSQMILYNNPKYNHDMWIKVKLFPFKEKNLYIIQIQDATKEHDSQHLLISQASNIKSRESQLNQITQKTYDCELNINLLNNTYDLVYYSKDNLYFGDERRGCYSKELDSLLKNINEQDIDSVKETFSCDNLNNHFNKFELDSISVRYRIGNEKKDNTWLESTIFFLSRKNKDISILTKNVTESTYEIRKQNVLLQNALNDAKMADKSKTELIATISHDIRTPLTNIIGISEELLDKKIDNELFEDIKNINESSNEVLDIVDSLLDTSKIEKKVLKKEEKEYNLLKLFKELEDSTKEYIENKSIKVNFNLDNNLPVILLGDDKRIKQALTKIINNSIKYTDEGLIEVSVKGRKINNSVKLIIEVSDTGIGINKLKLKDIMSNDNNTNINSVKKLIELLDGKFEIESKEGEYTKVTLEFSQKIVEDNKVREMISNNKKAEVFDLSGKKVLVVDDNELNLKVTKRLLSDYNVDVILASNGEECLSLIDEGNKYDLILMDQMMPGLSGLETLNKLKEKDNFKTRVVVLTADAMEGQKEKYLSDGFDDYISKPIDKKELSRILKEYLK